MELESLLDSNYDKQEKKNKIYINFLKPYKSPDLYEQLISTNNQTPLIPEICQKGQSWFGNF